MNVRMLVDCRCELGEGVHWRVADARVYWTDIHGAALWSCDVEGGAVRRVPLAADLCSFAFDADGGALGAFKDGLCRFDPDTGERRMLRPYMPDARKTRMNDGTLDRQGRFVVGGIDEENLAPICPVWRAGPDVVEVADPVGIANSIAFSPDGAVMYLTDTPTGLIRAYDYDTARGLTGAGRDFARVENGLPDGSAVDADGRLWTAIWEGFRVEARDGSGAVVAQVEVPVPQVTCVAFGGPDLRRMFITTARQGMDAGALAAQPMSGSLFAIDLDTPGLPHGVYTGGYEF
ncbi:SMP-30/gluconolactonase/LRE family protein [Pseudaestuariivita atlantica]|uniref:SMP-30/Gluconolactonase/LRE-like region domain-containing protein n=1 Tax=Pseudaestuariivita atlantica TaxID=1317121 RepID=A0A0L1JLE0_9RHOB|nr:SMP-30/gluconolactonase/LRE family protein [Pseudaestuariivita atlantica]KNG92566.1 hypothetical protein ATO11_16185 [Pseudaestuariivita atlantica]